MRFGDDLVCRLFFEQFDRPSLVCFRVVLGPGDGEFPGLHS